MAGISLVKEVILIMRTPQGAGGTTPPSPQRGEPEISGLRGAPPSRAREAQTSLAAASHVWLLSSAVWPVQGEVVCPHCVHRRNHGIL